MQPVESTEQCAEAPREPFLDSSLDQSTGSRAEKVMMMMMMMG